ncbi:hypothetical protein OC842_006079 [Tilletia horrida]|uniref:Uncharacterized protein n=1 Tax=Tilletia horrida TaxID=155126 RepID=A0AAN6G6K3_9BASI|nr:hypothetical protein OC842_006079 [Tilletia horrida]
MGTRVTSRAEGAHATLKQYLHSRHGNLYHVAKALLNHFVAQHRAIEADMAGDLNKVPTVLIDDPSYIELTTNVARYALRLIKGQDEIAARNTDMIKRGLDIPPWLNGAHWVNHFRSMPSILSGALRSD